MKILIVCIIFIAIKYVHNQSNEDYRIISKSGKLPIYSNLYYGIRNKKSGHYWVDDHEIVATINPKNASHWMKFVNNNGTFNYVMMTNQWVQINFHYFQPMGDNYYRITASGGLYCNDFPYGDGEFLTTQDKRVHCCSNCNGNEDYLQWKLTLNPDYKLNAIMTDFEYEIPSQDIINQHFKRIYNLHPTIIENNNSTTLHYPITNELKLHQTFQYMYSKSLQSPRYYFANFSVHSDVIVKFLNTEGNPYNNKELTNFMSGDLESVYIEEIYRYYKVVDVMPYTKLQVLSYLNYVDNLSLPFKAKLTVTADAPRFESDSRLDYQTIEVLLSNFGFNENLILKTPHSLTYEVSGNFIGSFTLDTYFSATPLEPTTTLSSTTILQSQSTTMITTQSTTMITTQSTTMLTPQTTESPSSNTFICKTTGFFLDPNDNTIFHECVYKENVIHDNVHNCTVEEWGYTEPLPTPMDISEIKPTLDCYKENKLKSFTYDTNAEIFSNEMNSDSFLESDRIIFLTHGFWANGKTPWLHEMKDILITKNSPTVCIVGWGIGANPDYNNAFIAFDHASSNSLNVGEWLGKFPLSIRNLKENNISIMGIGHSLGAHLMGNAGRTSFNLFDRISGLDPAGPNFETVNIAKRLRKSDAKFVDVIHTDGCAAWYELHTYFGTVLPLGTVDFYPNFGCYQPGWTLLEQSVCHNFPANITVSFGDVGSTSHRRAILLYTWSITNPNNFRTQLRLNGTEKPNDPVKSIYKGDDYAEMGYYADTILPVSNGKFYIKTNKKPPWLD